jgi:hypothetical protein
MPGYLTTHRLVLCCDKTEPVTMGKRKFQVGDKVMVIELPTITYALDVKDEMDTEKLLRSMLGKVYTVMGFDKYGNIELHPKRRDWVWIESKFLKLRARQSKNRT